MQLNNGFKIYSFINKGNTTSVLYKKGTFEKIWKIFNFPLSDKKAIETTAIDVGKENSQ